MNVPRVRAPELRGRGWLGTGGAPLRLAELRGKIVVLDFWTFCCINCLHVIDEMRSLEGEFSDEAVFVGVHSPKFEHEADPDALVAAVERYGVHHPVLDDPELVTWDAYAARAWPTLVVIDPEGYVVAHLAGEGHAHGLRVLLRELVDEHRAKGTLRTGDGLYVPPQQSTTALRFPGKAAALADGSYLVSDTGHRQIVHLEPDLQTERARFGPAQLLVEPQGVLALPPDVATRVGYDVLIADSGSHRIISLRLSDGRLRVEAGTGEQLRERSGSGRAVAQALSSPWDLAWWIDRAVIAMAGVHQLWALHLAQDADDNSIAVLAGTSGENLVDGPAHEALLAQPSGLASSADGSRVWIADSETSALRAIRLADDGFHVETAVGAGLFDFGHVDGDASAALMQHPMGVAQLPDGSVAVADTYNGAIRRYDPAANELTTLATDLAEPTDVLVEQDADGTRLVVVESAAHRVIRVALPAEVTRVVGTAHQVQRPPERLTGRTELEVLFTPPTGQKLDDRFGDPTQLTVSSSPPELLTRGAGTARGLTRALELDPQVGEGVLHVSVRAAACDGDPITGELPDHAACHLYQQDWGVPVQVTADAAGGSLMLDLRGV